MKKWYWFTLLIALLALPVVLFFLPADHFDHGKSLCFSQILLERECPGCGLTRGVQHLIHFDFKAAWGFNKLSFFILPVLIWYYVNWLKGCYTRFQSK